jgi:flagellar basal body-associated protein FliL
VQTFEDAILLKMALIVLVIVFAIVVLALMVQSFKALRHVQKQEAAEKKNSQSARQLHPKLQQKNKDQN